MESTTRPQEDTLYVPPIAQEFRDAPLGDRRLQTRLLKVVEGIAPAPHRSLPQSASSARELQGTYRFLRNKAVAPESILKPHIEQTVERCEKSQRVIVAHDTTEVEYEGTVRRQGLGYLRSNSTQGFLAHISLAVRSDGSRLPLGVLALHCWTRPTLGKSKNNGKKLTEREYAKRQDKESKRWGEQIEQTKTVVGMRAQLVHVMDREADAFELLAQLTAAGDHFVIRATYPRAARADEQSPKETMQVIVARARGTLQTEVPVSARAPSGKPARDKTFAPRESRRAKLEFSAQTLQLKRPAYARGPSWLTVNVVHVLEVDAAQGDEPIEWFLYTTEPVDTGEQVLQVVEAYRTRWTIEEFNKALKTGCSLEERQLESYRALLNVLCLFIPMAWQMLLLRTLTRTAPDAPATTVLTATQLEVLRECGSHKLGSSPSVSQVLIAVAIMGGYIPNKRGPGWLVLGRGMEKLLLLESGWTARAARETRPEFNTG
jgi:hypothetical protein